MNRKNDLEWYLSNRRTLAEKYEGRWIVVFGGSVVRSFVGEEDAIKYSVGKYGIDQASVFQAVVKDPVAFA